MAKIFYTNKPNFSKSKQVIPYANYLKISITVNILFLLSIIYLVFNN